MTCKDCIYYGVCGGFIPTDLDRDVFDYCREGRTDEIPVIEERCNSFKDKSRFVELPIRVGDKAFVLMFGRVITFIAERIELDSLEDAPTMRMHHGKHLIWEVELSEVGKTVFLAREEAEAELERRKHEHH